jgi:hypothetical protein
MCRLFFDAPHALGSMNMQGGRPKLLHYKKRVRKQTYPLVGVLE